MTQRAVFQTRGYIDLNALMTFGVSVKETDNPIGQFGTGLKYAIAILLREGASVEMYIGEECYKFWTKAKDIRGQSFEIVMMNDYQLAFTTELGKHWELWQAYRELESNTRDEGGNSWVESADENEVPFGGGSTTFVIEHEEFAAIAREPEEYFLDKNDPEFESDSLVAHSGESNAIFNRGIRVATTAQPMLHAYDILDKVTLTEDRTMKNLGDIDSHIVNAVLSSDDDDFIERIITAPETHYESGINFGWYDWRFTESFKEKLGAIIRKGKAKVNSTLVRWYDSQKVKEEKAKDLRTRRFKVTISVPEEVDDTVVEAALQEVLSDISITHPDDSVEFYDCEVELL